MYQTNSFISCALFVSFCLFLFWFGLDSWNDEGKVARTIEQITDAYVHTYMHVYVIHVYVMLLIWNIHFIHFSIYLLFLSLTHSLVHPFSVLFASISHVISLAMLTFATCSYAILPRLIFAFHFIFRLDMCDERLVHLKSLH